MAKSIYDYRDADGFLPEGRFDEWCRKHNLRRELGSPPRYDGIYATEVSEYEVQVGYDWETHRRQTYLRFYPDGTVLYEQANIEWPPSPKEMVVVFKRENKDAKSRGVYKLRRGQIAFEVIEIGPKPGLLRSPTKSKHSFLGLYLGESLDRGTLYLATDLGGATKYEFTFVKACQEEFLQAQPLSPSAKQAVLQLKYEGKRYLDAINYALALPIYEQIVRMDPTNDDAHFSKGICLSRLGSHDLALAALEQASFLSPAHPSYHLARGNKLWELQRPQEALDAFEACLRAEPRIGLYTNMSAWQGLSMALQKLGRTSEAQEAQLRYEQSNQLFMQGGKPQLPAPAAPAAPVAPTPMQAPPPMQALPPSASAQEPLAQLKAKGAMNLNLSRYDQALPIYEQILRLDPTNDDAYFNKGVCLSMLGSHDLALAAFEQASRLNPKNSIYYYQRGRELFGLWRFQEALEAFEQSLQADPHMGSFTNMYAWEEKSKALQKLGRTKEAQEAQQHYEQSRQLYMQGVKPQLPTSAPMQTLPPSAFAQQPVTQTTYKIGSLLVTYQQPGSKVDGLAWSPDGRRIASFGLGAAQVWVPLSGNILYDYKVQGFATIITAITWSPDSTRVATVGSDKVVQIWDANDGHNITAYKEHHKLIRCLSWSPNGQHMASCEETDLQIWNALTGQQILAFTVHPKALVGVRSLAWSPDATRIASGGGDSHVTVWNPNNGSAIYIDTQKYTTINGLAWSPDGKRIVSGGSDKTVHIWAAETGADRVICQGHTKAVNAVAFSSDGKRVASASGDTTVRIWSSETGQHLFTYEGHKKSVNTLAWSPDGKYIASGGDDKTVQVWACG